MVCRAFYRPFFKNLPFLQYLYFPNFMTIAVKFELSVEFVQIQGWDIEVVRDFKSIIGSILGLICFWKTFMTRFFFVKIPLQNVLTKSLFQKLWHLIFCENILALPFEETLHTKFHMYQRGTSFERKNVFHTENLSDVKILGSEVSPTPGTLPEVMYDLTRVPSLMINFQFLIFPSVTIKLESPV